MALYRRLLPSLHLKAWRLSHFLRLLLRERVWSFRGPLRLNRIVSRHYLLSTVLYVDSWDLHGTLSLCRLDSLDVVGQTAMSLRLSLCRCLVCLEVLHERP